MLLIDNVITSIIFEALLGVFLLDTYYNVRSNKKDNIVEQWINKDQPVVEGYTIFGNVFKKFGNVNDQDHINKGPQDNFTKFVVETKVFFHTALIIFSILAFFYLNGGMFVSMIDKKFRTKSSHILQPGKGVYHISIQTWPRNNFFLKKDND